MMQIKPVISPSKIGAVLGIVSVYLALQSLFNEYLESILSQTTNITILLLLDLFSVNVEESIPTWYSTLLLFIVALLLGIIAKAKWDLKDRFKYYWTSLALIFIYLSIDEGAAIHEILVDPLQALFHSTGYLAFAWQIVAVPCVILFVLLFIPFILHLPSRWRYLFILSGAIYVTGALGIEAVSANRWYVDGGITLPYLALGTVEELFEMLGMVLFVYTLASYMATNHYTLVLSFSPQMNLEVVATEALPNTLNDNSTSMKWQRLVIPLFCLILFINGGVYLWATKSQPADASAISETVPFYQTVIEKYSGQGVVVLKINGAFTSSNPAIKQFAMSLLVLFDDVLVVSLPQANFSVAFAGSLLPFNKDDLGTLLRAEGYEEFTILDTQEIRTLAQENNY